MGLDGSEGLASEDPAVVQGLRSQLQQTETLIEDLKLRERQEKVTEIFKPGGSGGGGGTPSQHSRGSVRLVLLPW